MTENEERQQGLTHEALAGLLLTGDCPVGYRCLAMDCLKCLQIYIDQGGGNNAETD